MVKKKIISDLEKSFLNSSKTGESVGNAKQTIFYFWPYTNSRRAVLLTFIGKRKYHNFPKFSDRQGWPWQTMQTQIRLLLV